jgi:hypothetical protein
MQKSRLEAFSDGVVAIIIIVPDRRIERQLAKRGE